MRTDLWDQSLFDECGQNFLTDDERDLIDPLQVISSQHFTRVAESADDASHARSAWPRLPYCSPTPTQHQIARAIPNNPVHAKWDTRLMRSPDQHLKPMIAVHFTCVEGDRTKAWAAKSLFGWLDDEFDGYYTKDRRRTITTLDQSESDLPTLQTTAGVMAHVAVATNRSIRAFPPARRCDRVGCRAPTLPAHTAPRHTTCPHHARTTCAHTWVPPPCSHTRLIDN